MAPDYRNLNRIISVGRAAGVALAGLMLISAGAAAFSGGAPDDFAGNPTEFENCTLCHASFEVNEGDGNFEVDGLPATFEPGTTYDLSVILGDPGQRRWGFELTAGDPADDPAGTFTVTDLDNTQLSDTDGFDFMKQTSMGSYNGTDDGPVSWSFQWTAPDVEEVTFYLAGNAANGDGSTDGDYIYVTTVTVPRGSGTPTQNASWSRIKSLYSE